MRRQGSKKGLVNLLNCRAGAGATGSVGMLPSSGLSSWGSTGLLVHLRDDRAADGLDVLQLVLVLVSLSRLVGVEPADGLLALLFDLLAVGLVDLALDVVVLDGGLHVEAGEGGNEVRLS